MQKTCTNSRCRRTFSTDSGVYRGCCPHCGKRYPRLPKEHKSFQTGKDDPKFTVYLWSTNGTLSFCFPIRDAWLASKGERFTLREVRYMRDHLPMPLDLRLSRANAKKLCYRLKQAGCTAEVRRC